MKVKTYINGKESEIDIYAMEDVRRDILNIEKQIEVIREDVGLILDRLEMLEE